jgi:hypothetical protein
MSGNGWRSTGAYHLYDILNQLQDIINNNDSSEHPKPSFVIAKYKEGVKVLKKAYAFMLAIDYREAEDTSDESFIEHLNSLLERLDDNASNRTSHT